MNREGVDEFSLVGCASYHHTIRVLTLLGCWEKSNQRKGGTGGKGRGGGRGSWKPENAKSSSASADRPGGLLTHHNRHDAEEKESRSPTVPGVTELCAPMPAHTPDNGAYMRIPCSTRAML